jgi:hypothetical protein
MPVSFTISEGCSNSYLKMEVSVNVKFLWICTTTKLSNGTLTAIGCFQEDNILTICSGCLCCKTNTCYSKRSNFLQPPIMLNPKSFTRTLNILVNPSRFGLSQFISIRTFVHNARPNKSNKFSHRNETRPFNRDAKPKGELNNDRNEVELAQRGQFNELSQVLQVWAKISSKSHMKRKKLFFLPMYSNHFSRKYLQRQQMHLNQLHPL